MMTWQNWECIGKLEMHGGFTDYMYRMQVPGGWLVWVCSSGGGLTFYPDPDYEWTV